MNPVEEASTASAAPVAQAAIPEGTVIGDGKLKITLARLDTRLLHGQVATAWTPDSKADRIIVASDSVAKDELRKELIKQAAPNGVKANVVPIQKLIDVAKDPRFGETHALILFETPQLVKPWLTMCCQWIKRMWLHLKKCVILEWNLMSVKYQMTLRKICLT